MILIIQSGHKFADDMCKIVTWLDQYFLSKSNTNFYKICGGGVLFLTQAWVLLNWKSTQLDIFILR